MMAALWVVLVLASTGFQLVQGLPVNLSPTPRVPHEASGSTFVWSTESGLYAVFPALALVLTAVGFLFGCTWCYRHKDCKPNEGADNQLFAASVTHLQDARRSQPPDSGFSEPVNNNISEDNNNGPISLREMQNIANNNAAAYIISENEERNRISRESVVEFEPLPTGIRVVDPLERCADWFAGEDFPRNQLQYLREIGRGWFGRVVEGEIEDEPSSTTVAVKILNQNASLEDKARFLEEARLYRDMSHENILGFVAKCLQEDPWILLFELCSMDLQQYLITNRPKMAILNERGVPLQLMCDVTSALAYMHSRGFLYGYLWSGNVLIRGSDNPRAVVGHYARAEPQHHYHAPESRNPVTVFTASNDVWSLGYLIWEICAWGASPPESPSPPDLPCPYRNHLYQVMQLCWNENPEERPTAAQVHALINHLHFTHTNSTNSKSEGYATTDFEERWQRLKPNTIPKLDEHIAIIHAPSTSVTSHFTGSDQDFDNGHTIQDSLSVEMDTAVSRSSSIMSDKDPLSIQIKSESLTNLHGSLEDVRNIYLTHNETAALECHQGNINFEESKEKDQDRSDSSVDPWLKDIITDSQDDVSYFKDVSDVIKNLDNILNSEKTSSSESSHQASPSRDNLSLECKKDYPMQTSMVKSPGISNFQNILDMGFNAKSEVEPCDDDDGDRDTVGTLSHSFERHSDTISQQTLENITPDTPTKELEVTKSEHIIEQSCSVEGEPEIRNMPNFNKIDNSDSDVPKLKELCVATPSVSNNKQKVILNQDCQTSYDHNALVSKNLNNEINEIDRFNNFFHEDTSSVSFSSPDQGNNKTKALPVCMSQNNELRDNETSSDFKSSVQESRENEIINDSLQSSKSSVLKVVSATELLIPSCQSSKEEKYVVSPLLNDTVNITESMPDLEDSKNHVSNTNEYIVETMFEENSESFISPSNESKNVTDAPQIESLENDKYFSTVINEEDNPFSNIVHDLKVYEDSKIDTTKAKQLIENKDEIIQDVSLDVTEKCAEKNENFECLNSIHNLEVVTTELPEEVQHKIDVSSKPITCLLDFNCEDTHDTTKPEEVQNSDDNVASHSQAGSSIVDDVTFRLDEVTESRSDIVDVEIIKKQNNTTISMDLINNTNSKILENSSLDDNLKYVIQSCLVTSGLETPLTILKNESTEYFDLPSIIKETNDFLHFEKVNNSNHMENVDNICTSTPKCSDPSAESTLEGKFCNLSDTKVLDYGQGVTLTKLEQKYVPESPFESPSKSHHTDTYDENSSIVLGPFENCTLELFKGVKSTPEITDLPREELLAFSSNFSEINLETPSPLRDGNFLNEVPDIVPDELHLDDIATISEAKPESQTAITDETEQSSTEKRLSPLTPPNSPGNFLASTSQQKYIVDVDISNIDNIVDSSQIDLQMTTKLAMADNENNLNIEYSGPLTEEGLTLDDSMLRDNDAIPESYLAGNGGSLEDLTIDEDRMKELRNELELKLPLAQVAGIEPSVVTSEGEWSELPPPPQVILTYGALSPIAEETRTQLSAYENDDQWNASIRTESSASYPEPCNNSTESATELPTGANTNNALPLDPSTYTIHSKDSVNHTYTVQKDAVSSKEVTMSADSLNASPLKKIEEIQSPLDDKTYIINDEEKESNCDRLSQVSPFLLSPTTDTSAPEISDIAVGLSTISKTTIPTDAKSSKPSETQCLSKATSIDSWCSNDTLYNVEENFDDLAMDPDIPMNFEEKDKSESDDTLTHNDDEKENSHCSTYIIHDSKSEVCETFSPDSITANDNYTYTKLKTDAVTQSVVTKSDFNDSTKSQTKDLAYGTLMSGLPSYSNCTTEIGSGMEDPWKFLQPELVRKSPVGDESEIKLPNHTENKDLVDIEGPKTNIPILKKMDSIEISCFKDNSIDIEKFDPHVVGVNGSPDNHFRHIEHSVTSTPLAEVVTFEDTENIESKPCHEVETINTLQQTQQTLSYADFEDSAFTKAQDSGVLSQSMGSGASSEDFSKFKNNAKELPQDLSMIIANQTDSHGDIKEPESLDFLPKFTNLLESQNDNNAPLDIFVTDLDIEEETEQPHSIIITESPLVTAKVTSNKSCDLHMQNSSNNINSLDSFVSSRDYYQQRNIWQSDSTNFDKVNEEEGPEVNSTVKKDETENSLESRSFSEHISKKDIEDLESFDERDINIAEEKINTDQKFPDTKCNGTNEMYATVNFLNETFEELMESNVDDHDLLSDSNKDENFSSEKSKEPKVESQIKPSEPSKCEIHSPVEFVANGVQEEKQISSVTEDFLKNEKKFCQLDSFFPLLSDIRFTGPATEIMTTSFTQDSPTEPTSPECEHDSKPDPNAETLKEWDSDSDSHSTNSSSGEFIWKDGDGHETALVPSTHFDHQRDSGSQPSGTDEGAREGEAPSSGTGDSGSGSEEEDVEFVPSSWDCRAAPSKSSLRSMEQTQDSKKKVVFKRQKYHCVYEYPREAPDLDVDSPAYLPDFSTYAEWDPSSAEDAELGYGQFFGANNPLDMLPLRAGIAFGADYDEDFFISSSARPFESLGVMSTTSQFFPGMHIKPSLDRDFPDDISEDFPPPPSPLPPTTLVQTRTPSLDFTTPDSGVEDITPGSITDDEFKAKKLPDDTQSWRSIDSASSSESVSPSSPGGEALGGLRHTRDKLKLDLPPSPHIPSPRHNRVFNFVLDKPKRQRDEKETTAVVTTPLVMSDETPIITMSLPTNKDSEDIMPEPTFSTFGKSAQKPSQSTDTEKNIILTDEEEPVAEVKEEPNKVEPVKGEGTVLDSGDEDSGIESSSKATLERKPTQNIS